MVDLHLLGHHFAGNGSDPVHVGIPELDEGLVLEPSLANHQAKHDAGAVVRATSLLGGLDDLGSDDFAVCLCDFLLVELARNSKLDQMAQLEGDLCDFGGGDRGLDVLVSVLREDWIGPIVSILDLPKGSEAAGGCHRRWECMGRRRRDEHVRRLRSSRIQSAWKS